LVHPRPIGRARSSPSDRKGLRSVTMGSVRNRSLSVGGPWFASVGSFRWLRGAALRMMPRIIYMVGGKHDEVA